MLEICKWEEEQKMEGEDRRTRIEEGDKKKFRYVTYMYQQPKMHIIIMYRKHVLMKKLKIHFSYKIILIVTSTRKPKFFKLI